MTTVLVAVDGTESDREVARRAIRLFGDDATYVVVSVSDEPRVVGAASISYAAAATFSMPKLSNFADGLDDDMDEAEEIARRAATDAGLSDADALGEAGDPATVLIEVAEEHDADVIAIGASTRGRFSKLFDPSVEDAVVDRSPIPVLVVPVDDD